jgi:hypothetical protein
MNVIPQSPPIKVTVTVKEWADDGGGWTVDDTYDGHLVAWSYNPDDEYPDLTPIVWPSGNTGAVALSSSNGLRHEITPGEVP